MFVLSLFILCIVTTGRTETRHTCDQRILRNLFETLHSQKRVIIIYEKWSEMFYVNLWKDIGIRYQLIKIDELCDEEFTSIIKKTALESPGNYLHFIVAARKKTLLRILEQINYIDENSTKSTNIRHWSTWLLLCLPEVCLHSTRIETDNRVIHSRNALRNSSLYNYDMVTKNYDHRYSYMKVSDLLTTLRDLASEFDNVAIISTADENSGKECCKVWTLRMTEEQPAFMPVNIYNGFTLGSIFPNIRYGYNGRRFLVLTKMWKPFIYEDTEGDVLFYNGYLVDLMDLISLQLNFSYTFYNDKESGWVSWVNGSFNKYLTDMMNGKYEIMCMPAGYTAKKEEAIDFVFPAFFSDKVLPIYKKPEPEISMWLYLKPLQTLTLVLLLTTCLVFCLGFWILERYNPYNTDVNNLYSRNVNRRHPPCLGDVIHHVVGVVLNQGGCIVTKSSSGRLFLSFFWMFCVVMAAVYRGNLVAFLAFKQPPELIHSVRDMINSGYKIGMVGSSSLATIIKNHSLPMYRQIYQLHSIQAATNPEVASEDNDDHLKSVMEGGYIYVIGTTSTSEIYAKNCDTARMTEALLEKYFALGTPTNSPVRYDLEKAMLYLENSGILLKLQQKWWPSRRPDLCELPTRDQQVPVQLQDIYSIFIVLTGCMILSAIVLYGEIVRKRLS